VLNKDGSFQRTRASAGPDLDSAVAGRAGRRRRRLNNALRRLGSGWAIFVEAQRSEAATYPESMFPDPRVAWSMPSARPISRKRAHFESAIS
jgi:type IV secretion system protein VirB4